MSPKYANARLVARSNDLRSKLNAVGLTKRQSDLIIDQTSTPEKLAEFKKCLKLLNEFYALQEGTRQ